MSTTEARLDRPDRESVAGEGYRYRHPIEIRYADTDALGHVNNAVYLSYFEAARAGYYAALTGRPFGTGEATARHIFVIAEAHVTYRSPALFGEPLECLCRVAWAGRSSFGLEYRLRAADSLVGRARSVAEGWTAQVFYDLERAAVARMPTDLVARMEAFEGRRLPARHVRQPALPARGALRPRNAAAP